MFRHVFRYVLRHARMNSRVATHKHARSTRVHALAESIVCTHAHTHIYTHVHTCPRARPAQAAPFMTTTPWRFHPQPRVRSIQPRVTSRHTSALRTAPTSATASTKLSRCQTSQRASVVRADVRIGMRPSGSSRAEAGRFRAPRTPVRAHQDNACRRWPI